MTIARPETPPVEVPEHLRPAEPPPLEEVRRLVHADGLQRMGVRPPLGSYLRRLWGARGFLWSLATARATATNQNNYLGQLWSVLNPLLLTASYYFVFGFLLDTSRGTDNFIAFLTIGIFVYGFTASSMTSGAKAVTGNINLVRSLHFPRAVLPVAVTLQQLLQNLPAFGLLLLLLVLTGERPSPTWLLFPVALGLVTLMNTGIVLILARLVETSRDLANLVPVATRLLRYISGVFFSIEATAGRHGLLGDVLIFQPFAVQLSMVRQSVMGEFPLEPRTWIAAVIWTALLLGVGLVFFWRGEARYGRG